MEHAEDRGVQCRKLTFIYLDAVCSKMHMETWEKFVVESTCEFCGLNAYLSVFDFGRALRRREIEERVWQNDEPHFHCGVCLDGFELV